MTTINKIASSIIPTLKTASKKITAPKKSVASTFTLPVDSYGKALVQKRIFGLFDIDKLPSFPSKKMETFEEISPDKLLFVHLTDYLPTNGKIQSTFESSKAMRNTTHFALNHSVLNPFGAGGAKGWTEKKYVIFAPFEKTCAINSPIGGKHNDFMFEGGVNLPEGSFIYRQNLQVPQGKIKFSDAFELTKKHGITLIEAQETPYNMGDDLVIKFGYTNLKDLHAAMVGQNRDIVNLANDFEKMIELGQKALSGELSEEEIIKLYGTADFEKLAEEAEKNIEKEKMWSNTWNKFIKSLNLADAVHSETPYANLENIAQLIDSLHLTGKTWQIGDVDCRAIILEKINEIMQNPEFKIKFIDLENLKRIIQNSATPTEVIEKLSDLGFKGFEGYSKATSTQLKDQIDKLIKDITYVDKRSEYAFGWNY